ncbi:hypothetical protein ETN89_20700 (plasmid) [Photobacterium damselae subsp. damselae]|uniref:hypothetical protein n=1 Tax=Photobacterium damselae TaxID=38293 RepID=UPI000A2FB3C0|nr:hypothetical protein [Photobacterium damselae]ARR51863.1 hypothetical protein CAY62_20900 [Photobacterium damselae subsp. damselae]QAY37652.1 hypothetical protein ETN89_20700 [Photobacterium damselae subsp. damselae]
MLDLTDEHPDIDIDDIQSRYPNIRLTKADQLRILQKRRHRDFIQDLQAAGITYEEYLKYETKNTHARHTV